MLCNSKIWPWRWSAWELDFGPLQLAPHVNTVFSYFYLFFYFYPHSYDLGLCPHSIFSGYMLYVLQWTQFCLLMYFACNLTAAFCAGAKESVSVTGVPVLTSSVAQTRTRGWSCFGGILFFNACGYSVDNRFNTLALNDIVLMKLCLTFYYLAFICSQLTYRSLFGLMHWEHLSRSGEDGERNRVCRRLTPGAAARGRQWKSSCPVDNGAELLWISLLRSWREVPEEWMDINEASKPWGWPCICSTKAERLGICLQPELPPIRVILVYFRNECQGRAHKISIFLWEAIGGSEPTHKVGQTPRKPPRYLPNQLHWTAYQPRAGWRQHAWWRSH